MKKEKKQAETPDVIGSKGDHKNVCLDCEEESDEDGGNTCAICKHFFHSQCQPCDTASTSFVCRICCERKFTCFKCKMEIVPETEENDQKGDSSIAWVKVLHQTYFYCFSVSSRRLWKSLSQALLRKRRVIGSIQAQRFYTDALQMPTTQLQKLCSQKR